MRGPECRPEAPFVRIAHEICTGGSRKERTKSRNERFKQTDKRKEEWHHRKQNGGGANGSSGREGRELHDDSSCFDRYDFKANRFPHRPHTWFFTPEARELE